MRIPKNEGGKLFVLVLSPLIACIILIWDIPIINWEFEKLCKAEAGIHVYEEVILGPESWKKDGALNLPLADHRLTNEMPEGFEFLDIGNSKRSTITNIRKYHYQIKRKEDKKILGELIRFSKGRGWLPWGAIFFGGPGEKWCPTSKEKPYKNFPIAVFKQHSK